MPVKSFPSLDSTLYSFFFFLLWGQKEKNKVYTAVLLSLSLFRIYGSTVLSLLKLCVLLSLQTSYRSFSCVSLSFRFSPTSLEETKTLSFSLYLLSFHSFLQFIYVHVHVIAFCTCFLFPHILFIMSFGFFVSCHFLLVSIHYISFS